jgi:hypothetical protein
MFKISIPWRSITKYGIASGVMSLVLILLPSTNRILTTLIWTVIGGIVYLVVLIGIDKETRSLPKAILQEVRGRNSSA